MRDRFIARWGPLFAFVALMLALIFIIDRSAERDAERLRTSVVQSCERANVLRREFNDRVRSHQVEREVLRDALNLSRVVVGNSDVPEIRTSVAEYDRLIRDLRRVHFETVVIPDCEAIIPK